MRRNISFKGVILGSFVDIVGTNIWVFAVELYLLAKHQLYTLPVGEQTGQLQILLGDPAVKALNTIVGCGFSIIGGYLAARIAGHHQRLNGALASFLCVAFTLTAIGSLSIGWVIEGVVGSPILGLVGGYLSLWQKRSRN
jgi:MFS family permease